MILAVTNQKMDSMDCVHLRPTDLNLNEAHAIIASQVWDECYIDVDESIEEGKLRYMHKKCRVIKARFDHPVSRHQMVLLTELYPDLNGTIRKAFLKGDDLHAVLPTVWGQGDNPGGGDVQVPASQ